MPSIADVVADLLAHPQPILCLDTCDLLDIIQCVADGKAGRLEHIRRLIDTLTVRPNDVRLMISYLVPIEWAQNQASVIAEVERKTHTIQQNIADLHRAWNHVGSPLPGFIPSYAGKGLPNALAILADEVLGWATVLDRDDACIHRALDRVHNKVRPSQNGMVKDSIHLEHYLELCRQLHAGGFPARRVLVSANKADFWEAKNNSNIHPDLVPELASVGLEFYGILEAALGSLGI